MVNKVHPIFQPIVDAIAPERVIFDTVDVTEALDIPVCQNGFSAPSAAAPAVDRIFDSEGALPATEGAGNER